MLQFEQQQQQHGSAGKTVLPTFRKLKVTGPRTATMQVDTAAGPLLSHVNDLNPTLKAMLQTNTELTNTLKAASTASKRPSESRGRKHPPHLQRDRRTDRHRSRRPRPHRDDIAPSSAVAIHDSLLERLRALKSQFDSSYDPVVQMLVKQMAAAQPPHAPAAPAGPPAPPPPPMPPAPPLPPLAPVAATAVLDAPVVPVQAPLIATATTTKRDTSAASTSAAASSSSRASVLTDQAMSDAILNVLPTQYHNKCNELIKYVIANPKVIRASSGGQLVLNDVELSGSSFAEVMRCLYLWRRSTSEMPATLIQTIKALKSIKVPEELLSSSAVRSVYVGDDAPDEEVYESPDEELKATSAAHPPPSGGQSGKGNNTAALHWPGRSPKVLRLYK